MVNPPKHFTVVDPRTADGDPYEVAVRGIAQLEGIAFIALEQVEAAKILALNAALERQLTTGKDADPSEFHESPEGTKWALVEEQLGSVVRTLSALKRAASFNPRAALPAQSKRFD